MEGNGVVGKVMKSYVKVRLHIKQKDHMNIMRSWAAGFMMRRRTHTRFTSMVGELAFNTHLDPEAWATFPCVNLAMLLRLGRMRLPGFGNLHRQTLPPAQTYRYDETFGRPLPKKSCLYSHF